MRKAQDPASTTSTQRTPAFFSNLKYDREQKQLEHKALYAAQLQMQQAGRVSISTRVTLSNHINKKFRTHKDSHSPPRPVDFTQHSNKLLQMECLFLDKGFPKLLCRMVFLQVPEPNQVSFRMGVFL
jgi:hypothetical protein